MLLARRYAKISPGWRSPATGQLVLAACYVSRLATEARRPGKDRMIGIDATHAWASVWTPQPGRFAGGKGLDPTNDQLEPALHRRGPGAAAAQAAAATHGIIYQLREQCDRRFLSMSCPSKVMRCMRDHCLRAALALRLPVDAASALGVSWADGTAGSSPT